MLVHTNRLTIKSNSLLEMQAMHDTETDEEMIQVYQDQINEMKKNPEYEEWACEWSILLKDTDTIIGGICFKGLSGDMDRSEIGYGIDEAYRRQGYATEAVNGMVGWAFSQKGIQCVLAQTDKDNEISQRVLANNGFTRDGYGEEGPMFKVYKK